MFLNGLNYLTSAIEPLRQWNHQLIMIASVWRRCSVGSVASFDLAMATGAKFIREMLPIAASDWRLGYNVGGPSSSIPDWCSKRFNIVQRLPYLSVAISFYCKSTC